MQSRRHVVQFLCIGCAAIAIAVLTCCSGGSGGGSSAPVPTGSVSVLIADGPSLKFEHVWVDIVGVTLIPAGHGKPVVVFEGKETIDLLAYQEEDFVLASGQNVPTGSYDKIRLEISDIRVEPALCSEVKLPSGKIDLVPHGSFEVEEDSSIVVRIDIDAHKSISVHEAGKSGKCIFRPVVFVHVLTSPALCRQEVAGKIVKIYDKEYNGKKGGKKYGNKGNQGNQDCEPAPEEDLTFLNVDLGSDRGIVRVAVNDDTALFDSKAVPVDPSVLKAGDEILEVGDAVLARGILDENGRLTATWVIEGQPEDLRGTFKDPIAAEGTFTFLASEEVSCRTSSGTKAYGPCDSPATLDSILAGQAARILGATVSENDVTFFRVAVIDLGPTEVSGDIVSIDEATGDVTVHPETGDDVTFHVTDATEIKLVGDGSLTADDLRAGETIDARLEPATGAATRIEVVPEDVSGKVSSFDATARTFALTPEAPEETAVTVTVFPTATVLLLTGESEASMVDLSELANDDEVTVFGLVPAAGAFDARVVLIRR